MSERVHDDVEAYALGALEPDEASAFEAHLADCPRCRAELGGYAPVLRALRELPLPAPPPLRAPQTRMRRTGLAVAAAVALVAAGGVGGAWYAGSRDADVRTVAAMEAHSARDVVAGTRGVLQLRVVVGAGRRRTAIVLAGAAPPPPGRAYQVWLHGATTRSPGLLHRSREGLEILVLDGTLANDVRTIGVTVEPAGGSPRRTGPALVTGTV